MFCGLRLRWLGLVAVAAAPAAPAAVATAAAAAAATTAAVAAAATAATAAVFLGLGLVDGERAPTAFLAVERRDGRLGLRVAAHLDEPEALAAARVAVRDDLRAGHGAVTGEHLLELRAIDVVAQISDIQ